MELKDGTFTNADDQKDLLSGYRGYQYYQIFDASKRNGRLISHTGKTARPHKRKPNYSSGGTTTKMKFMNTMTAAVRPATTNPKRQPQNLLPLADG